MDRGETRHNPGLIVLGGLLALGVPVAAAMVAALWTAGWIEPDDNGALVLTLQSLGWPSLAASPVGLVLAAWATGARKPLTWLAILLYGVPLLAIVWFVSIAWLGGLAGEPF
jgi:hypothetical protein